MNSYWTIAAIEWTQPARLIGLLLAALVVYVAWRHGRAGPFWRRTATTACRSLIVTCLLLAWAGITWRGLSAELWVVFVRDRSASVEGDQQAVAEKFITQAVATSGDPSASYVDFAARTAVVPAGGPGTGSELDRLGSDPAAAMLLAASQVPPSYVPKLVLLSDGNATQGETLAAGQASDAPLDVVPLASFSAAEVAVTAVHAPAQRTPGDAIEVEVTIFANRETKGTVELYQGRFRQPASDGGGGRETARGAVRDTEHKAERVAERTVRVVAGSNRVQFRVANPPPGDVYLEAKLRDFSDTYAENNQLDTVVFADASMHLLLVDDQPARAGPFVELLRRQQYDVQVIKATEFPTSPDKLTGYDLVIFSDVSAQSLGRQALAAASGYVQQGGGLLVAGGEGTFGPAEYRGTPLEALLPLTAAEAVSPIRRSVAMLLVIDKSTSMQDERRMALAKEAAKRTVDLDLLSADDKLGILAFGDHSEWVSPIVRCDDKQQLKQRIDQLEAKGQTNMFPALQRALLALSEASADRRHVILLTDGVPAPGDFDKIARQMAAEGITVSTVSVGAGADQTILKDISRIAGGRHLHCERPDELTEKLVGEARSAVGADRTDVGLFVYRQLPDLDLAAAPKLGGYVSTSPKPGAELLLLAEGGDPLLAWWRYGAGVAMAFTSDISGPWGKAWYDWNGHERFWSRVARHVRRKRTPRNYQLDVQRSGDRWRVVLDVVGTDGRFRNGLVPAATVQLLAEEGSADDSARDAFLLPQVAPGRYERSWQSRRQGNHLVAVSWKDGQDQAIQLKRYVSGAYPDEFWPKPVNETLLRSLAAVSGGSVSPQPAEVYSSDNSPDDRTAERVTPLWRACVMLAIILLVVETGLRRVGAASADS